MKKRNKWQTAGFLTAVVAIIVALVLHWICVITATLTNNCAVTPVIVSLVLLLWGLWRIGALK